MLLFLTPDDTMPSGGIKQIYRHVEILDRAGIPARVLHTRHGFRCDWFAHRAPLAYLGEGRIRQLRSRLGDRVDRLRPAPDLRLEAGRPISVPEVDGSWSEHALGPTDLLVLPEFYGAALNGTVPELPVVIFNQNAHLTFRGYGWGADAPASIYTQPNLLGCIVVSEHNRRYLEYAFPELAVRRVVNGVDARRFHPGERGEEKRRQIAFMPRRLPDQLEQVLNLLRVRGALEGWSLAPIAGLDEAEVAETLRRSLVYLSTCRQEGFGLPPVEAGFCGCLVVGYTGAAADEYFEAPLCERVEQEDVLGFAAAVEDLLRWCENEPEQAVARGRALSEKLAERYSLEHEKQSVLAAWRELIDTGSDR